MSIDATAVARAAIREDDLPRRLSGRAGARDRVAGRSSRAELVAERTRVAVPAAPAVARPRPQPAAGQARPEQRRRARPRLDAAAGRARAPGRAGPHRPTPGRAPGPTQCLPRSPGSRASSRHWSSGVTPLPAAGSGLRRDHRGTVDRRDRQRRPLPDRRASSPATPVLRRSRPAPGSRSSATGSIAPATASSTPRCT